ncbi:MAG: DUF3667 domain-containing protein [Bacteroidales bacterium]|nr:DUF3667 domain-containing protein [Bacteroidales bacterium]
MKKSLHIKEKLRKFKAWLVHIFSSCIKFCREKLDRFKAWREQPREVAPMIQEEHECQNCHDHYTGNFCPRCGQAATTDRFSMKVAAENFADAYGMGERGMFRTMRDLLLRPGYLILDYLRGMRVSYFAPFKMFFLLFAISTLVTHGLNIKGVRTYDETMTVSTAQNSDEEMTAEESIAADMDDLEINGEPVKVSDRTKAIFHTIFSELERFEKRFPSINMLFVLMIVSGFLYLFFRHSPNIPDMHYSEFFIALLYTTNMYTIYSIVFDFFCLSKLSSYAIFLTLIPLKQMSGFSWWRTALKSVAAFVIMASLLVLVIIGVMFAIHWFAK